MDYWRKSPKVFWSFGIPPTIWLFAFFLAPLFLVWGLSFGEKQGIIEVAITGTLENYSRAVQPLYLQIFLKSFWYAALTTFFCLVISFPVSLAITFAPERWKPILLLLVILPFWTNLLIRTYALIAVLRTNGYLNDFLELIWLSADSGLRILGLGDWNL
ncbi:MAG: ABC transporter permease, partial [SAR324 cluster bacterium]|nr:ABC transporter permease [SAR324 cluster bacterium]